MYKLARDTFRDRFLISDVADAADSSVPPALSSTELSEREGPLIEAAASELPKVLHGRKYAEFQRLEV